VGRALARAFAGTPRDALRQDVELRFRELDELRDATGDAALQRELARCLAWLWLPASTDAPLQSLRRGGDAPQWRSFVIDRCAKLSPAVQPALAPAYWELAGTRDRVALQLALTFEPDGARVARFLEVQLRARDAGLHEIVATALPLRWRHGLGELSAATGWLAAVLERGTSEQLRETLDGLEDGLDEALADGEVEL